MVDVTKKLKLQAGKQLSQSDQDLLDVIESNVLRLPGNDNSIHRMPDQPKLGLLGSAVSTVAFGGLLILGALLMAVLRLVPSSEDHHY